MINKQVMMLLAVFIFSGSQVCHAVELPVCSNRVINEVTKRIGCTVGDLKCWLSKGGFCTDYIEKMAWRKQPGKESQWETIYAGDVKKGDIAIFNSRAHYSYVESVVRGNDGKPRAVNVSEYNFGTCWVDQQIMVTEKYKIVNKRSGIPLNSVDGGFMRPKPVGTR